MARTLTEEKREAILAAAAKAFSLRDFHAVLTDEIAADAGVGKGTLYRYFRTKDDLYFVILMRGFDEVVRRLPAEEEGERPAQRLARIGEEVLRIFWRRRPFSMLLHLDERRLEDRHRELRQRRRGVEKLVEATIAAGVARGDFRPVDPGMAANLFLGMVRSALVYRREGDTAETCGRQITDLFIRGLETKEAT